MSFAFDNLPNLIKSTSFPIIYTCNNFCVDDGVNGESFKKLNDCNKITKFASLQKLNDSKFSEFIHSLKYIDSDNAIEISELNSSDVSFKNDHKDESCAENYSTLLTEHVLESKPFTEMSNFENKELLNSDTQIKTSLSLNSSYESESDEECLPGVCRRFTNSNNEDSYDEGDFNEHSESSILQCDIEDLSVSGDEKSKQNRKVNKEVETEKCKKEFSKCDSTELNTDDDRGKLDLDEDESNPAYIPRSGHFYMHDHRQPEEVSNQEITPKKKDNKPWTHDRFRYYDQAPKSNQELIWKYGYNIRTRKVKPNNNIGDLPNVQPKDMSSNTNQEQSIPDSRKVKSVVDDTNIHNNNQSFIENHSVGNKPVSRRNRFSMGTSYSVKTSHNIKVSNRVNNRIRGSVREQSNQGDDIHKVKLSEQTKLNNCENVHAVTEKMSKTSIHTQLSSIEPKLNVKNGGYRSSGVHKENYPNDKQRNIYNRNVEPGQDRGPKRYSTSRQHVSGTELLSMQVPLTKSMDLHYIDKSSSVQSSSKPLLLNSQIHPVSQLPGTIYPPLSLFSQQNVSSSSLDYQAINKSLTEKPFPKTNSSHLDGHDFPVQNNLATSHITYDSRISYPLNANHLTSVYQLPQTIHHYTDGNLYPNYLLSNGSPHPHIPEYYTDGLPSYQPSNTTTIYHPNQMYMVPVDINSTQPQWNGERRPVLGRRPLKPLEIKDPRDPTGEVRLVPARFTYSDKLK